MVVLADSRTEATLSESVGFTVLGQAAPAGSKRAFRHNQTGRVMVADANKRAKPWQALVSAAGYEAMVGRELFRGPLEVRIWFHQARPAGHYGTGRNRDQVRGSAPYAPATRPDVLKLARAVEDALTGVCWLDDAQIVTELLFKRYGLPPRAEVFIVPLGSDLMPRAP